MGFRKFTEMGVWNALLYVGFALALFVPVLAARRTLGHLDGFQYVVMLLWWAFCVRAFKGVLHELDDDD